MVLSVYVKYSNLDAIEIFKYLNRLSPPIMNEVFQVKPPAPYSYGTESISFLSPKIWSIVPQEKQIVNL